MSNQRPSTWLYASRCLFILIAFFLISCSSTPEHRGPSFDSSRVNRMVFRFESNTTLLNKALPQADINKTVVNNLTEWGYQFAGQQTNEYTHDLTIRIGSIHIGSTPSGLSFSTGNSNPRALDFQKATTLPLTCSLMPKGQKSQRAELVMEVMAEEYRGSNMMPVSEEKMLSRISDDISTTCFNLLSSLNVKTIQNESTTKVKTPTWMPKIYIEIENSIETNSQFQKQEPKQKQNLNAEPRKRVIIHNQGNPVIFKFGPDR